MSYYFLYQQKKIPSFAAYLFIFVISLTLIIGFKSGRRSTIVSRASKETTPQKVLVSNLNSESVNVSFFTKEDARTFIRYREFDVRGASFITKFDSRDSKTQTQRKTHYFEIAPLKALTKYELEIYSEGKLYTATTPSELQFQTPKKEVNLSTYPPVFGKVLNKNFQGAADVLIKIMIDKAQGPSYTALTKNSGEWILTLANIRDSRGTQIDIQDTDILRITAQSPDMTVSKIGAQYQYCRPLRTVVLGQDYDFTSVNSPGNVLGAVDSRSLNSLITYPRNGAILSSSYPVFRGKSTPLSTLQLVLMPQQTVYSLTTDIEGQWRFTAEESFLPGTYRAKVVNVKTRESETIDFHVGKSGEQVLGEATESAKPTTNLPKPTTAVEPTPTTATPTQIVLQNTPTPKLISPTVTQRQIPITGSTNNNILILLSSGISLLGLFLVLY